MIRFDTVLAAALVDDRDSDPAALRASLAEALAFVGQFESSCVSNHALTSLDACALVQHRRVHEGLSELRLDAEMWWYEAGDPLGTVRFRLTSGDMERMLEACEACEG